MRYQSRLALVRFSSISAIDSNYLVTGNDRHFHQLVESIISKSSMISQPFFGPDQFTAEKILPLIAINSEPKLELNQQFMHKN